MYTIFSIIFVILFLRKKIVASPITSIFILSYIVKVGFTFYWFEHLSFFADVLACICFLLIVFTSVFFLPSKKHKNSIAVAKIAVSNLVFKISLFAIVIAWFLFLLPNAFFDEPVPIIEAILGDHRLAHHVRILITKKSEWSSLLDITGKILLTIPTFVFGLKYNLSKSTVKFIILVMLGVTIFVSVTYFQKALPFSIIGAFFFGLLLSGGMTKGRAVILIFVGFSIIFSLSSLFVEDKGDTIIKFNDLVYRRLGQVPALVYQSYINYGEEFDALYLEYNFVLNKSVATPALPMIIYGYMSYGESSVGWANGLFIGDAYVNFGLIGVIITSFFIGLFIRFGNKLYRSEKRSLTSLVSLLSISLISFYLPGNAFYGYTIFLLIFIFVVTYILSNKKS